LAATRGHGTIGKSFDTHGPIGPWIVTQDELPGANKLFLKTWVNGELRQDGNTDDLIYQFEDMLTELSTSFTLEPGDILSHGHTGRRWRVEEATRSS